MTQRKSLYLLDGTALLYRGHFGMINNPLTTSDGRPTSGIFGFVNSLLRLFRKRSPDLIAAVFDAREKTFRHTLYTEYKATREKMPDDLIAQIEPLDDVLNALRMHILRLPGYEADDIMGTLATRAEDAGFDTYLVTNDKDMMQLVTEHIFVYTPASRLKPDTIYGASEVEEKWGLPPQKMIDFLGLMGDASDNVPGVAGVGEKTARKLLLAYGDLESVLDHAGDVKNKRAREGLEAGREIALLSRELVTIKCDVPIEIDFSQLVREKLDYAGGAEALKTLEIRTLAADLLALGSDSVPEVERPARQSNYSIILTEDELTAALEIIEAADWLSIDLETTSVKPMEAEIVGIALSIKPLQGWYIPIVCPDAEPLALAVVLERLRHALTSPELPKVGQNIKYDALILARNGIELAGIKFDTLIAAHMIDPGAMSLKLEVLSERYLNHRMIPIEDLIGPKGKKQGSMTDVPLAQIAHYAAEDADIAGALYEVLATQLAAQGLDKPYEDIEIPLIPVLIAMENFGVALDVDFLNKMSADLEISLRSLEKQVYAAAGTEFNVNSPQQLGVVLFDQLGLRQVRKRSTDVNVLEILRSEHPLPGIVLDYRQVKKLKSTYVDTLPELVNAQTGRVHSTFSQSIAATGRLSSSNPNFQNIPIRTDLGREIRRAFRPQSPGWSIFSADYSQIELRIMAHLAQERTLIRAFHEGADIHTQTAAMVFDVAPGFVTPDMRRTAKVVNFGIMYGAGAFRMAQELGVSMQKGRDIINRYFNTYPDIRRFIDSLLADARESGFVTTILGRKRPVPNLNASNQRVRSAEERVATNTPIQGSAAELIKIAMIRIHKRLLSENYKSRIILQIHDELLFEVPDEEIKRLDQMVKLEMEGAMQLNVPLVVETGWGSTWYEAH